MPTSQSALIAEAKRLQRLQSKRRKLRADLRLVEEEMRVVRRHLRGLSSARGEELDGELPGDQLPPRRAKHIKAEQGH